MKEGKESTPNCRFCKVYFIRRSIRVKVSGEGSNWLDVVTRSVPLTTFTLQETRPIEGIDKR